MILPRTVDFQATRFRTPSSPHVAMQGIPIPRELQIMGAGSSDWLWDPLGHVIYLATPSMADALADILVTAELTSAFTRP